jgi:hypothetical protein
MIYRLHAVRGWISKLLVVTVIVAAVFKDKIYEWQTDVFGDVVVVKQGPGSGEPQGKTIINEKHVRTIVLIIVLIIFYGIAETAVEASFDKSRVVRKVAMGKSDIEDVWLDIVYLSDKVIGGGYIVISYDEGKYRLDGEDFNENGYRTGDFESTISDYDNHTLLFKYIAHRGGGKGRSSGHGEYKFSGDGHGKFSCLSGHFYEDGSTDHFYIYGERLKYIISNVSGNNNTAKSRKQTQRRAELVKKFLEECKNKLDLPDNFG